MNDADHTSIERRLAIAAGHIKAIERMAQAEDAYCIDIVRQIQAVQAALNKINSMLLDAHLDSCMVTVVNDDDVAERERMLKEVASIFQFAGKR